jgi:hypothetical protein
MPPKSNRTADPVASDPETTTPPAVEPEAASPPAETAAEPERVTHEITISANDSANRLYYAIEEVRQTLLEITHPMKGKDIKITVSA